MSPGSRLENVNVFLESSDIALLDKSKFKVVWVRK